MTSSWKNFTIDAYLFDFMQANLETVWRINQSVCRFLYFFSESGFGNNSDWNVIGTDVNSFFLFVLSVLILCSHIIVCILDELKVNHKKEVQALEVHKQTYVTLFYTHPVVAYLRELPRNYSAPSVQQYTMYCSHST